MTLVITSLKADPPRFRVIDITPLNGIVPNVDTYGSMGINNFGEVVYATNIEVEPAVYEFRPWVWLPATNSNYTGVTVGFNDLSLLEENGYTGIARDINDLGIIVGQTSDGSYFSRNDEASMWVLNPAQSQDQFTRLGVLGALVRDWSGADAISNDDPPRIVGGVSDDGICYDSDCTVPGGEAAVFRGFMIEYPDLMAQATILNPSSTNSAGARGVSSTIVAEALVVAGGSRCHALEGGCLTGGGSDPCEPLRGATYWETPSGSAMSAISAPVDAGSIARAMSDWGRSVGWAKDDEDPNCNHHALYWHLPDDSFIDLGDEDMPTGQTGNAARAEGLNNLEYPAVVGWDTDTSTAILWEQESSIWTATNLSDPDVIGTCRWVIRQAHDINSAGWIAATAADAWNNDALHAIVLIPDDPCPGDLDFDSDADTDDLLLVVNNWGTCPDSPTPCLGDGTCNGTVDVDDLLLVINNWGDCPLPSLQESFGGSGGGGSNEAETPSEIVELLNEFGVPSELIDDIEELLGL